MDSQHESDLLNARFYWELKFVYEYVVVRFNKSYLVKPMGGIL